MGPELERHIIPLSCVLSDLPLRRSHQCLRKGAALDRGPAAFGGHGFGQGGTARHHLQCRPWTADVGWIFGEFSWVCCSMVLEYLPTKLAHLWGKCW